MKKTKDLFLITAVVCTLSALINLVYAIDCAKHVDIFYSIVYSILCIASIASVVAFIYFRMQSDDYLKTHKPLIRAFSIVSILCSLLGGIVAIYAYYTLTTSGNFETSFSKENSTSASDVEIINDKRMAKYIDDLNRLEDLKKNGIISETEFNKLKNQIISEYLK